MMSKFCSKKHISFVSGFWITSVFAISFFVVVFIQSEHEIKEVEDSISLAGDLLHPPVNTTAAKRIAWFKDKLPEFQILKSTTRSRQFDYRVTEFLGGQGKNKTCMAQFFMTWISPASLFGKRELLSLETVFKAHPRGCLVIVSRTMDSNIGRSILEPLMVRGFRLLPIAPDLPLLFNNTPAQAWLENLKAGKVDPGRIPLAQNLSNLLRLAILYKYGGVYLDTDFIILKDFSTLRNSIGAQSVNEQTKSWTRLNNAVLIFDKEHPLLLKFMQDFVSHFDGNKWGHNGPYMVSRVARSVANDPRFEFVVMPPLAFYPVDWLKISGLFERPDNEALARWVNIKLRQINEGTYGVHLWNKESRKLKIQKGSIIEKLISDHCIICQDIYDS